MLKDPEMNWDYGPFPYDALADAGVTANSTVREVRDCQFDLVEKGLWNLERRAAWDQLRVPERRLWVDFLMYPFTPEELCLTLSGLFQCETAPPNPEELLKPDFAELQRMNQEFRKVGWDNFRPGYYSEFQAPDDIFSGEEFDS